MKVLSFIGQKGGTGKSSLALALAVEAERRGRRVALIDLDPQTTAANWSDRRGKDRPAVVSCQVSRLPHVLAAAEQEGVDLAIIDTPGKNDAASIAAARSADLVLMPIQPMLFDIETLASLKDVLSLAGNPRSSVLINRAPVQGRRHIETAEGVVNLYSLEVCPVVIHARAAHSDAGNIGLTASELDPEGKAAQEVIDLYNHIVIELKGGRHGKAKPTRRGA
jgi:chromosome partitioning protein